MENFPKTINFLSEQETQKGKYKNPKVQKSKRCEIVKSNNKIIQKSKTSNMHKITIKFVGVEYFMNLFILSI